MNRELRTINHELFCHDSVIKIAFSTGKNRFSSLRNQFSQSGGITVSRHIIFAT